MSAVLDAPPQLIARPAKGKCGCGRVGEMNKPPTWFKLKRMDRVVKLYFSIWRRLAQDLFDRPRIPQQLSEGLVAYLTPQLFGPGVRCSQKTKKHDPDLMLHFLGQCDDVEVKGSGSSGWVEVTEKDLRARYLVWAHFGARYETDGRDPITIFVLAAPDEVLEPGKPSVKDFALLPGVRVYSFDFAAKTLTPLA